MEDVAQVCVCVCVCIWRASGGWLDMWMCRVAKKGMPSATFSVRPPGWMTGMSLGCPFGAKLIRATTAERTSPGG